GGSGGGGSGAKPGGSAAGGAAGQPGAHAQTQPFPDAPKSQRFDEFGRCPVAAPSPYLPKHAGCLTVRRADVDGDGRTDLVLLYARLDRRNRFTLKVVRARGETATARVPRTDLNTTILRARNLDGRAGFELLVHEYHVTTEEGLGAYTFAGTTLRRAGGFTYDGADAGI